MTKPIRICNAQIHPGERANLALPLPALYNCTAMHMPIKVLHGVEEGPCVVMFAAGSGTEMNGVEIINRLLDDLQVDKLKGTVIAVPVLNVYGMLIYPHKISSAANITTSFPGNPEGTFGERTAHIFTQEILTKADYCIELLTGDIHHSILPQVYCNFDNLQAKKLAKIFGAPVIIDVPLQNNKLRQTTETLNLPLLVYEAGEAMRFNEADIELGVQGIQRVLGSIGVVEETPDLDEASPPLFAEDHDWIRADKCGIVKPLVSLGQRINKKEVIAYITDPFSADLSEAVVSPHEGLVVGINQQPLIFEGERIFKIASFIDNKSAEERLETWDD